MRNEEEELRENMITRRGRGRGRGRGDPKEYGRLVSNMAIAQICKGLGFESLNNCCLEAFSNILLQFILDLGKSATFHANLASRSHSTFFDILEAFQDLGFTSTLFVKRISDFVKAVDDNPIPRFPLFVNVMNSAPSFSQMGENPVGKHIPDWLPAFPDPHTYLHSPLPLWTSNKLDLRIDKGQQARLRRKAERSLLNLQQRLLSSALADDANKDLHNDNKHLLVKEAFAPAIHALKGAGAGARDDDSDDDDGGGGNNRVFDSNVRDVHRRVMSASVPIPVKRRPVVQFKMKAGKKMLVQDLDIHIRSLVCEKRGSFVRDDDRDDKKRRAEFVLRQSAIEYPQEVSQM